MPKGPRYDVDSLLGQAEAVSRLMVRAAWRQTQWLGRTRMGLQGGVCKVAPRWELLERRSVSSAAGATGIRG